MTNEKDAIRLIVGLGNIGKEYEKTRHNVGFWFADLLADNFRGRFNPERKFSGEICSVKIAEKDVLLLKPSTLMNRSGISVQAVANFYKVPVGNILVVHDELDLLPGFQKLKVGGGSGGHNGIKSIIQALGSPQFPRLRIGIGHPRDFGVPQMDVADFVLSRPSSAQLTEIEKSMVHSLEGIPDLVEGDIAAASKIINTKIEK